mgnify:FL=1
MRARRAGLDISGVVNNLAAILGGVLLLVAVVSVAAWLALGGVGQVAEGESVPDWVDPITEIEDENHSHNNLSAHVLFTENMRLIDYHNLNCDGSLKPPAELDNTAGRECYPEFKNVGPTPGDNSEIVLEGYVD